MCADEMSRLLPHAKAVPLYLQQIRSLVDQIRVELLIPRPKETTQKGWEDKYKLQSTPTWSLNQMISPVPRECFAMPSMLQQDRNPSYSHPDQSSRLPVGHIQPLAVQRKLQHLRASKELMALDLRWGHCETQGDKRDTGG